MNRNKVIIGLSGGVDSSVAAYLLKQDGFEVIGVTLKLFEASGKFSDDYIKQAKQIANNLEIEHLVIDVRAEFETKIIKYFANEYFNARTPSPCTLCNKIIKHKTLLDIADKNNAYYVATGHYISIKKENNKHYIYKGKDNVKDQSYFLWQLTNEMLSRTLSPLGKYSKDEVRQIASKLRFKDIYDKKESMGVCFLQKSNYRDFLKNTFSEQINEVKQGNILDESGNIIGTHSGLVNYTIGQKNGITYLNEPKNLYVKKMDNKTNTITVCEKQELNTKELYITDYSFIDIDDLNKEGIKVIVRGYGLNPEKECRKILIEDNYIKVELEDEAWAPANGQPIVFYIENKLLGGGITYIV